jgi:glycosyltransferase involved in cell wall biosynthesis
MPLVTWAFDTDAPSIAGLHGSLVNTSLPPFDYRDGPFILGANALIRILGNNTLSRFDAVHSVSPTRLEIKLPTYNIPNWVDCGRLDESIGLKEHGNHMFRVLYVGRPLPNRGFFDFLSLSQAISLPDIEFVAVVPEPRQVAGLGRIKAREYAPHDQIWRVLAESNVLVHPIRIPNNSTVGRTIMESLASATPVITTPLQQRADTRLPLFSAYSPSEMKQQLLRLYELWKYDRHDYLELCRQGGQSVRKYDKARTLPRLEEMLTEIAKG